MTNAQRTIKDFEREIRKVISANRELDMLPRLLGTLYIVHRLTSQVSVDRVIAAYVKKGSLYYPAALKIAEKFKPSPNGLRKLVRAYVQLASKLRRGKIDQNDTRLYNESYFALQNASKVLKLGCDEPCIDYFIDECIEMGRAKMAHSAAQLRKEPGLTADEKLVLKDRLARERKKESRRDQKYWKDLGH